MLFLIAVGIISKRNIVHFDYLRCLMVHYVFNFFHSLFLSLSDVFLSLSSFFFVILIGAKKNDNKRQQKKITKILKLSIIHVRCGTYGMITLHMIYNTAIRIYFFSDICTFYCIFTCTEYMNSISKLIIVRRFWVKKYLYNFMASICFDFISFSF